MKVTEKIKRDLIIKTGKTVTSFARDVNMSRPHISQVVNGKAELSITLALRLELIFGIDARRLLVAQLDEQLTEARRDPENTQYQRDYQIIP